MKKTLRLFPFLLVTGAACAQVPPDAGSLLQQIEKNRPPALPKQQPQELKSPPPMESLAGPTVTVRAFRFQGNTLLTAEQLAPALASFLNRPLSFDELQQAVLAVGNVYRQAGWIVRAYLPRQEIEQGVVTVQIVEAAFGGARFDGTPQRITTARLQPFVESAQPRGTLVNADALDRAILLIDDLPGVGATGNLAAGERENETILILKLTDEPFVSGEAGGDNTSSRSTGSGRATLNFALNSPFKLGDQLSSYLLHSDGSDYARLAYTLPLGGTGWRAGINGSTLRYRLVADEFSPLHARGTSDTAGAEASYPLIRARTRNLYLQLNADAKRFDNQANGITVSHYKLDSFTAGLSGNVFDEIGGGGGNNAGLFLMRGKVKLGGSPNEAADALSTHTAGNFTKLRYNIGRQQTITETLSFSAILTGQQASTNLDSSEKFYLGGYYGVRAYPSSEGGGSNGQMVNLDLSARIAKGLALSAFYDWGHVTVNHDNNFPGGAPVNSYSLKGAGLALGWTTVFKLNLKAAWARRIGSNPNPTPSGSDQDGTLRKNRYWLLATMPF